MRALLRTLAVGAGLIAGAGVARAQQGVIEEAGSRDTVYVVRRDTLVVMRRDTVYVESREERESGPGSYGRMVERERDKRLRKREERAAAFLALPPLRTRQHAFAHFLYPTRFLRPDFSQVAYGLTYVNQGCWGANATVGFLLDPRMTSADDWNQGRFGRPRYGLRGLSVDVEGRYYASDLRDNEPLYLAFGLGTSQAPVTYDAFVVDADAGFARLGKLNAIGRQVNATMLLGWDGRFGNNFAAEVAFGAEFGRRGLFAENPAENATLNAGGGWWTWGRAGSWFGYASPVLRIGVGIGKW